MLSNTTIVKTPIGNLSISEQDGYVIHYLFTRKPTTSGKISSTLKKTIIQIEEYFSGQRQKFNLPLKTNGTTFQQGVWRTLQSIPYGEKWNYRDLAEAVGNPKASRAVGTANAKNQIGIIIPCHRVILDSGKIGGYAGGPSRKAKLLEFEENNQFNNMSLQYSKFKLKGLSNDWIIK